MKITYWKRDDGACAYYRVELPIKTLCGYSPDIKYTEIQKGDNAAKIEKSFDCDLIIQPRPSEMALIETIKVLKEEGKKVVIDHDDNFFSVSPLSPHYEDHGIENVRYRLPNGKMVNLWEDGRNIDLKKNRERLDGMKRAMELVDMVTVTTEALGNVYREFNDNIRVLPNCVDGEIWRKLPLKERDDIRVGWSGGHSHYEDWMLLSEVMPEVMKKHPRVKLVLSGAKFDGTLKFCPKDRVEYHPWVHMAAHPYRQMILDIDIALIPLRDSDFNRCKSPIKWIEAGALKIPAVTSLVAPYREVMTESNGLFIEDNDKDGWIRGISMLIEDEALRKKIGMDARKTVMESFNIHSQYSKWITAYREVIDGGPRVAYAH